MTGLNNLPERIQRSCFALGRDIQDLVQLAREEKLTILLGWLLLFMFAGSVVFFTCEVGHNPNVSTYFDALYWSIVSITTVGYGDLAPVTPTARVASIVMILSFMALMPLVGATITSIYVTKKIKEERGLENITFTHHIVICGWNNNGQQYPRRHSGAGDPKLRWLSLANWNRITLRTSSMSFRN